MKKSCFTLVEIVMVVALIAVLTGIAIGGYSYAMGSARESATRSIIKQLGAALENAKVKHGFYPVSKNMPEEKRIQLLKADGEEIDDDALAKVWGTDTNPLPKDYIKDFRKTLDFESLREYIDDKGYVCDAWGTPLVYTAPDTTNRKAFTITSYGPDGESGGDDDITN